MVVPLHDEITLTLLMKRVGVSAFTVIMLNPRKIAFSFYAVRY
jgi:hypothetical protein